MSAGPRLKSVHAGFIPLVDAAPLIMAKELGLDIQEEVALHLHREVSWANIRDKVNVGRFDAAHMLAPMPLAATLGVGHVREDMIAPMTLNLNGNAITVSPALYDEMRAADPAGAAAGGRRAAEALAGAIRTREAAGAPKLTLGAVYPFSCHAYELRFWLAEAGVDPDRDLRIVVLPPSLMAESVEAGHIQGFCAGEPWNSVAVEAGVGRIVATKAELWRAAPEKVLGVRAAWAAENVDALAGLIRALVAAARWLESPSNRRSAAETLAKPGYLNLPVELVWRALGDQIRRAAEAGGPAADGGGPEAEKGFVLFGRDGASRPSELHALWLLTQMARWGEAPAEVDLAALARRVSAVEVFDRAMADVKGAEASGSESVEHAIADASGLALGGLAAYLRGFAIAADRQALDRLAAAQPG